jgi:PAS domain S-box-containing protein
MSNRDGDKRSLPSNAYPRSSVIDALRRSEQRLSLVLEAADLGQWDWDLRTNQLIWSERCLELFGLPRDTGMTYEIFLKALHPEDRERTHHAVRATLEKYRKFDIEYRTVWPDGAVHWLHARGRAFYEEGQAARMTGVVWDITERKRAEEAVVKSEQRFRELAESLPQLVWVTNAAGENTYFNSRFAEYTGLTPLELMKDGWHRAIHPDDLARTMETWSQCIERRIPFLTEYRLLRHDGAARHFLGSAVPLVNDRGEVEQWFGSSTDIHDQKTGEVALRRSEKLAVAGRFATSIAHEINNPLMSVIQLLYLMRGDESLSEGGRGLLEMAEQEVARVAQVVAHMLHFRRGGQEARKIDVREIVDSVLVLFSARLSNTRIHVQRELDERAEVVCYRDDLAQAISNILSNAYNALRGGGTLRIHLRRTRADDGRPGVRLTIADNGIGIPLEIRRSLFEPFSTSRDMNATGMGMWATAEIVRQHGGRIAVKSSQEPGYAGTTIRIFLPLRGVESGMSGDGN